MCPLCITTAALIASATISAGGLAALIATKFQANSKAWGINRRSGKGDRNELSRSRVTN